MSIFPPPRRAAIVVMNTPFGNSITTAEHAIALMFALARQLPEADASTQAGKWEKNRFMGVEVTGKTLGLIGCGNIGSIVANRALGLRMKVVAFDPFLTPSGRSNWASRRSSWTSCCAAPTSSRLHTPLTDQTRGILSREDLAKTKKGVRIINCARGGLIDEAALKDALDSGQVARRRARRVRDRAGHRLAVVRDAELHLARRTSAPRPARRRSMSRSRSPSR